jgi:hypothetical protein
MTTISDSEGFIDYVAFGIDESDLQSLRALDGIWKSALNTVAGRFDKPRLLDEFVRLSGELAVSLGDVRWQRQIGRAHV